MKTSKKIKLKSGDTFQLEIYSGLKKLSSEKKEELVNSMRKITSRSWHDFKEVTYLWLEHADILLFVIKDGELIAFSSNKFFSDELIVFLSTMVLPEYQTLGIAKKLHAIAIGYFAKSQISRNGMKFWKNFSSIYFAYRTPNPRAVNAAIKYDLSLPFHGRKPLEKELEMAKSVADIFSPTCHFDNKHFVIEGAFINSPELIYEEEAIPWSGDEIVDDYCAKYLDYKNKKGNLLVIVGRINPFTKHALMFV